MLEESVHVLEKAGRSAGLKINVGKTKTITFGREECENEIEIENERIENVNAFTYLRSLQTWDNDCTKDTKARIAKGKGAMAGLKKCWTSKQITYKGKLSILGACVFSTALYACETCMLKKTDRDRILAFEMYCNRWMLHIKIKINSLFHSRHDKRTNCVTDKTAVTR